MAEVIGLVRYDAMTRAIAECVAVDEIKDIRDKALAMERYAQQAMNVEAERQANEIRLRAERRFGELSVEIEKDVGGRPKKNSEHGDNSLTKERVLDRAGVSQQQASRWERLAKVPQDDFEKALNGDAKPTTNGILRDHGMTKKRTAADNGALWLWGHMRALADFCEGNAPDVIAKAIGASERKTVIDAMETAAEWFEQFTGE
jgi:hypothetical protein